MRARLLLSLLFALLALTAPAQEHSSDTPFNGLVTTAEGKGVRARVTVKNSGKYTIADKQGRFGLTNVAPTDTLVVKFKGDEVEIPLAGRRSLQIVWIGARSSYEESEALVDSGFGYIKRREYTSRSSGLSGDEIRRRGFSDLQSAVLALVPGAKMINGELTLGGTNSINYSSAPLIICDGSPINSLFGVSVQDVESVEVQRGPNMYGLRGGNGVIIIRTRGNVPPERR